MKLSSVLVEQLDIELTRLDSTVDEEVLKDMLDPWYQRLTLKGKQVLDYYKCTIEAVDHTLNHEHNKALEDPEYDPGSFIDLKELFYSVKEKCIFALIDAIAESGRSYPYLHLKYDLLDGKPKCKRIKPSSYPARSDDDIDLMKVLPERVLDDDWL